METTASAARAFREGRLLDCQEHPESLAEPSTAETVLGRRFSHLLGRTDEAETVAGAVSYKHGIGRTILARCTSVLADCQWYRGERDVGLELYQLAPHSTCRGIKGRVIACRANTQFLERTCDRTGL